MNLTDKDFLNIQDYIHPTFTITCILSDRGLGKTDSGFRMCVKTVEAGNQFAYCRLNKEPIKHAIPSIEKYGDWKCSFEGGKIFKGKDAVGLLTSLSTYANTKGGLYKNLNLMLFDEFNEDVYIENAFAKFIMMIDSLKRHRKDFKCVLLGNMINKNNWFLNAIGIDDEIDWYAEDDQIIDLKGIRLVVIGRNSFPKLTKEREDINELASLDPNAHAFYNEREFLNQHTDLVINYKKRVEQTFQPLFIFCLFNQEYIFGYFMQEDKKLFFIDRKNIYHKQFTNLKKLSLDTFSNTAKNAQILEEDDIDDINRKLFLIAKDEKLRYGSFDAYEDLARFISLGSLTI